MEPTESPRQTHDEERGFAAMLEEMRNGATNADLTKSLSQLAQRVIATKRPGKLILSITIEPNGDEAIFASEAITVKAPDFQRSKQTYFVADGKLSRRDPRQIDLPL